MFLVLNGAWFLFSISSFRFANINFGFNLQVWASPGKVLPRDPDAEDHGGVDDMTKLTYLNEPGVLYNLERRYALNDIYVSVYKKTDIDVIVTIKCFVIILKCGCSQLFNLI